MSGLLILEFTVDKCVVNESLSEVNKLASLSKPCKINLKKDLKEMKNLVYLLCLFAAFYLGGFIGMPLTMLVATTLSEQPVLSFVLTQFITLLAMFVPLLVVFRVFKFIKSRSIAAPQAFRGGLYLYTVLAAIPGLLVIDAYIYVVLSQDASGLSGIPLAYVLFGTGLLLALPVLICEAKAFYHCMPSGKSEVTA